MFKSQRVMQEFIRGLRCEHIQNAYSDTVDRFCDSIFNDHLSLIATIVVTRPSLAVIDLKRHIGYDRIRRNLAGIHRRAVNGERFDRRTGLTCGHRCTVCQQAAFLFTASTDKTQNISLLIADDHSGLRNDTVLLCAGEIGFVGEDFIHRILNILIDGRIDLKAAGHNARTCKVIRNILSFLQVLGQFRDDRLGKPRVGFVRVLFVCIRMINQFGVDCLVILSLRNKFQLEHFLQYQCLTFLYVFRIAERVVTCGRIGDCGKHSAFGQIQFVKFLAEVSHCGDFRTSCAVTVRNCIQIHFQDLIFCRITEILFQSQRLEDLIDLTFDRFVIVSGQVFDQLLGDGRTTTAVIAGDKALNCTKGAEPVYTMMRIEALVFDGDNCFLQIFGDLVQRYPLPVDVSFQSLIYFVLVRVWIFGINDGSLCQILAIRGYVDIGIGNYVHADIKGERNTAQTGCDNGNERDGQNGHHELMGKRALFSFCHIFRYLLLHGCKGCR